MTGPENYIKDIESSDKLSSTELSVLNAYVEAEFRKFSENNEINENNRDKKQEEFNKKIDEIVESEKEKAIFSEIIKFQFELTDLSIKVDLSNIRSDVENGNETNSKNIENQISGKFRLYNGIEISDISNELVKLGKSDQDKIISLLSSGKIKELQKNIIGLENLPKYKDDGKFGAETLFALKKYTDQNKYIAPQQEETPQGGDDQQSQTPGGSSQSSGETPTGSNSNSGKIISGANQESVDNTENLTEVTDESEKKKITDKGFNIPEFKRGKMQKNSDGEYFAQINANIDGTEYDIGLLKFDQDGNLLPDQLIKTTNKEREALYFVDDNQIKFLARYSDGMYLTKDTVSGITPIEEPESLDNNYNYKPTEFNLMEGSEVPYEFKGDLGYSIKDLENKHPKLKDIMDKIIDAEEGKEKVSKRKFKINLSPNDGLARIILDIDSGKLDINRDKKGKFSQDDIKRYFPYYKREGGRDSERRRIAIILNQADQDDLLDFAYNAQSYGETYKEKFQQADRFDQIIDNLSSDNILEALCDFNTDGQISVVEANTQQKAKFKTENGKYEGRRKDYKKQKQETKERNKPYKKSQEGIGDTATIFGPQLYSEINRAIAVLDVKLKYEPDTKSEYMKKYNLTEKDLQGDGNDLTGEKIVIENIMKNIAWTTTNPFLEKAIGNVKANQWSRQKLLEFAQNYMGKEGFENNGNFQPLFAKSIEELNGSSSTITPDLADNLTGVERLDMSFDRYSMIEKELNDYLSKHPEMEAKFKSDGFTDTKHTFITGLMSVLDNLQISLSPDQGGISKSRDIKKYRHKLENEFTRNLIGGGITFNPATATIGLKADIGKYDFSENGKFVRGRNVGPGVQYNTATGILAVTLSASVETSRQYNYKGVITSRLDDIKTGKYVGLQAGTSNVGGELAGQFAGAGVAALETIWKQDPKQGIEQMTRQYRDVSSGIFYLPSNIDFKHIQNKDSLEKYLISRLDSVKNGAKEPFKSFILNNEGFLKGNIKNISDYFDKKGIFKLINDMPSEFAGQKKRNAINNLIQVLQTGIVDSRRDYMYDQLHGKVSVTKLGGGIGIGYMTIDGVTFGIPFPTLNFNISTWRKNYISSEAGKYMDQEIIRNGQIQGHTDQFKPDLSNIAPEQRLNAYADYIKNVYNNIPGLEISTENNIFTLTYSDPTGKDRKIKDIIDIRCKVDQKVLDNISYSDDGKTLVIGDVGEMSAFTSSDGQSSRNFLIIGQKGTIDKNNKANTAILRFPHPPKKYLGDVKETKPIKYEKIGLKSRTYQDIENLLDSSFAAEGQVSITKIEDVKTEIKSNIRKISGNLFIQGLNNKQGLSKFPITGTLIFTKNQSGKLEISSSDSPIDKLDIKYYYIETQQNLSEAINITNTYNFENIFSYPDIDKLFEDSKILEELSKLDNGKINTLNEFLDKASHDLDSDDDINIDDKEYEEAAQILKKFLGSKYQDIVKVLDGTDIDSKVLLINRMKGIFATDIRVLNGKNLQTVVNNRKDRNGGNETYKYLKGPSGKELPILSKDYRKSIIDQLASQSKLSQDIQDGLFGYTAFYRRGTKIDQGKTYSMTALGATKVLGGISESFSSSDSKLARNWFMENLKYNTHDLDMIKKAINQKLPKGEAIFSDNQVFELLSGKSLDIGDKKYTLNSECVFYLLGECANESVGIKLNGLTIESKKTPGQIDPNIKKESYSGSITPIDEYSGGIDLSSRNLSVAMVPGAYEHRIGINLSGKSKFKDKEGGDQGVEEEGGDQGGGDGGGDQGGGG